MQIVPRDYYNLTFGAMLGFCFLAYLSSRVILSVLIGIPIGIGGMTLGILLLRWSGLELNHSRQDYLATRYGIEIAATIIISVLVSIGLLFVTSPENRVLSIIAFSLFGFYGLGYLIFIRMYSCRNKVNESNDLDE